MNSRFKKFFLFPVGNFGFALVMQAIVLNYTYYYAPPADNPLGFTPLIPMGLLGIVMIIGRVVDGISDPLIAYWSDNCSSKLGRRIPFLLFGGLPLALTFIAIWFPVTDYPSMANFVYLSIIMALYFFFFTLYVNPYLALIPDISETSYERVKISSIKFVFNTIALIFAACIPLFIQVFNMNMKTVTVIFGVFACVAMYMPAFVKERYKRKVKSNIRILESIKLTFMNEQFRPYLVAYLMVWFAFNMLTISLNYIGDVLMGLEGVGLTMLQAIPMLIAIASAPLSMMLSEKKGKKWTMNAGMLGLAFFTFFIFLLGRDAPVVSSQIFGFIVIGLAGVPLSILLILPDAILSDLTDYDAYLNTERREAMFFGVQGLVMKFVIAASSFVTNTILFELFGYTRDNPLGINLVGLAAPICLLAGFYLFRKFNLYEVHKF